MTAFSDETGREQAFERFPKLAGWIERLAGTQMDLSLKEWGEFLAELNVALSAAPVGEPALRMCGYCKTWNSKPCGEQCYLQPSDPVWTAPVAQEPVAYLRDLQPYAEDEALAVCNKIDPGAFAVFRTPPATSAGVEEDWRDDPSADERWQAGLDYGMERFCSMLGVDPKDVRWDAATEELDGDVCAVIGNILRVKFGDDFDPMKPLPAAGVGADEIARAIKEAIECITDLGSGKGGWAWEEVVQRLALLSRGSGSDQAKPQQDGSL